MALIKFRDWVTRFPGAVVLLVWLPCWLQCQGQQRQLTAAADGSAISSSTAAALREMTRSAWVIFAGQVIAVERPGGYDETGGRTVTVEFRVDEAVRGSETGSVYTLKEWGGLWNTSRGERYRVGQRLLMFLHRPGASGLSSPVNDTEGAVPLRGGGLAPGPYDGASGTSGGGIPEWVVDLRWVQAHAVRGKKESGELWQSRSSSTEAGAGRTGAVARDEVGTSGIEDVRAAASAERSLLPVEGDRRMHWAQMPSETERALQPLSRVLELCRGWMGTVHVDR